MLKRILSVSGKPGLFQLISTNKNITLVESLKDGKRLPIHEHEKIMSLGEISIYTSDDEVPLKDVFVKIKEKEDGNNVSIDKKSSNKELFSYFEEVLPNYDKEKVYASDIKKIISWYDILIEANIDFEKDDSQNESEETETSNEAEAEEQTEE